MKLILGSLVLLAGICLTPLSSLAQEQNDCFMLDANGEPINLGDLCPGSSDNVGQPSSRDFFSIPIKRRESKIAVIEVIFNGQHTFEMLVDTGASATVLTSDMANILEIEPEGTVRVATAGGVIEAPVGRINSIEAGGISVKDLVVTISPNLHIGLLGQDFFGNYDLIIKENTVEFHLRK